MATATRVDTTAEQAEHTDLIWASVDQLVESPLNARRRFDPVAMKELADSIERVGMLTPLLVRPMADGRYEIAAGARRLRAAKKLGIPKVPVIVRPMTDTAFLEVITIENLQREDVHPLDEALGYQRLLDQAGYDVARIADRVGKSTSYIYQRLKLAELIPPIQKVFLEDRITASHAILVARLQPTDQERVFKEQLFDRRWVGGGAAQQRGAAVSVRVLEEWIHEEILLDLHSAPWKKDDATLLPRAGPCTTCPKRTGNQPQLFPDVKEGDTCTDPGCFALKFAAFVEQRVQEVKAAEKREPLRLSAAYDSTRKTKIPGAVYGWARLGSHGHAAGACKFARTGVVVEEGYHQQNVRRGDILTVCAEPRCTVHHRGSSSHGLSAREQADRRRRNREQKIKATVRSRILDAVLAATPATLKRQDFEFLAQGFLERVYYQGRKAIADRHQVKPIKRQYSTDYEKPLEDQIPKMSDVELARFLYECVLAPDRMVSEFGSSTPDDLLAAAKLRKVDIRKVERTVRAEFAAKAKRAKPMQRAKRRSTKSRTSAKHASPPNRFADPVGWKKHQEHVQKILAAGPGAKR